MRFLVFVFSVYIFGLALMPCTDAESCDHEQSLSSNIDLDHDHSEDETDTCSPFCSCACCGVSAYVVQFQYFFTKNPKVVTSDWIVSYKSDFVSSYYYSFWQPPKV